MMTVDQAKERFNKEYPGKDIKVVAAFDNNTYLFIAMDKGNEEEVGDPNYLINKNTGQITQFNPMDNFEKFNSALQKRRLT